MNNFQKRLINKEMQEAFVLVEKAAKHHNCTIDYDVLSNNQFNPNINFKFNGDPEDIKALQNTLEINMIAKKLSKQFSKQKINYIEEKEINGRINIRINVNKLSNFKQLAESILFNLKISYSIEQEKLGLFKGKNVLIELHDAEKFQNFKALVNSFIHSSKNTSKKIKM